MKTAEATGLFFPLNNKDKKTMKHIKTFESFLNEALNENQVKQGDLVRWQKNGSSLGSQAIYGILVKDRGSKVDIAILATGGKDSRQPETRYDNWSGGKNVSYEGGYSKEDLEKFASKVTPGEGYDKKYLTPWILEETESANEGNDLSYWKDYEVDNSPQAGATKWMSDKCENMSNVLKCIDRSIDAWNEEADKDSQVPKSSEKHIGDLAIQFFKKFGYINGNIITAMIMQES